MSPPCRPDRWCPLPLRSPGLVPGDRFNFAGRELCGLIGHDQTRKKVPRARLDWAGPERPIFWTLNWGLSGLRTQWAFFPLWLGYCLTIDGLVLWRTGTSLLTRSWQEIYWPVPRLRAGLVAVRTGQLAPAELALQRRRGLLGTSCSGSGPRSISPPSSRQYLAAPS